MTTNGTFTLNAVAYRWYVEPATTEYPGFSHEPVKILRVIGELPGFDVAIRVRAFENEPRLYAGPLVVLGESFPSHDVPAPKGARIRIRPKVARLSRAAIAAADVSRIIAWCLSEHFRCVRADVWGMPQASLQDDYSIGAPPPRDAA